MTDSRKPDRLIGAFLSEGVEELPDRVYDSVRDQLHHNRQRVVIGPWRMPIMNNPIRIGLAAVAALVVAVIGIQLLGGGNVGGPPDATPSPSAAASPKALPIDFDVALKGRYSLAAGFPVAITFDVPAGWVACSAGPVEQGACEKASGSLTGVSVSFTIIDNVVADPCGSGAPLLDPPVGPSVDDLVAAISNLPGFEATSATDVTVDGFSGKQFTLTAPSTAACSDIKTWATADRTNGVSAGEVLEMRILDVGGVRVVIAGSHLSTSGEAQLSTLHQVIASSQIAP
jgi:hypothetical protein